MKRAAHQRLFLAPLVAFVALALFSAIAPSPVKLGDLGEWAAALAGFVAASVALYLAGDSERRSAKSEELERNREVWRRAAATGVELWVEVDRTLSRHGMTAVAQKRHQIAINLLMATAEHERGGELGDYSAFLCEAVWQPLVAIADGSQQGEPTADALRDGLSRRQDYLSSVNAVADMKSFDTTVSLEPLNLVDTLNHANVGLNWNC